MTFEKPASGKKSFTCPHCGVLSRHYHWGYENRRNAGAVNEDNPTFDRTVIRVSQCEHCEKPVIWHGDEQVFPAVTSAPPPNPDMPADVLKDYREAARILSSSPRGAAALLRLSIQKLTAGLGGKGKNINDGIKHLVANGLPDKIQKALDVVRVTGNNAVHPGQIDTDDEDVAGELFPLVNLIVEYMITLPEKVEDLYQGLPSSSREAIDKRDNKTSN